MKAEFIGTPIYKLDTNIYIFQWDYQSMNIEDIQVLYDSIKEKLPKDSVLIGIPNISTLRKVDVEDLKVIKKRITIMIEKLEGDKNDST